MSVARTIRILRFLCAGASIMLFVLLTTCYGGRYDWCAAITIYPPWCWVLPGILLAIAANSKPTRRLAWGLIIVWCVFLVAFFDTPAALLRGLTTWSKPDGTFRVISFNCEGNADAAKKALQLDPDIVLFQETPRFSDLTAIAEESYGLGPHFRWSFDTSLIARGEVEPIPIPRQYRNHHCIHSRIKLTENATIDVICLRLRSCPLHFDLWNWRTWIAYRVNRQQRHQQLAKIVEYLASIPADRPILVGGDFNAPAGDAIYRLLQPQLTDAFVVAGRGWGQTWHSRVPVVRIDQIWTNQQLRPVSVFVAPGPPSDHLMVVADFKLPDP